MAFGNITIYLENDVFKNESLNFGRILPEMVSLALTCSAWGNWIPEALPRCIRK